MMPVSILLKGGKTEQNNIIYGVKIMLINLNRGHIEYFNAALHDMREEFKADVLKGKTNNEVAIAKITRCEYLRETLHIVGSISIKEEDFEYIKEHLNDKKLY